MLPALERKKEMHSFTTADTGIIVTNCKSVVVAVVDYVIIEKSMMQILYIYILLLMCYLCWSPTHLPFVITTSSTTT